MPIGNCSIAEDYLIGVTLRISEHIATEKQVNIKHECWSDWVKPFLSSSIIDEVNTNKKYAKCCHYGKMCLLYLSETPDLAKD